MKNSLGATVKPPATVTDLTGKTFNRWKCLGYVRSEGYRHFWLFRCKCGTELIRHAGHIVGGRSTSCGCKHSENLTERNQTHCKSGTREHVIWKAMLKRCYNRNDGAWERYGGRGITVCARWRGEQGFANFLTDLGTCPQPGWTVERKNNSKGYCPGNCVWASRKTQCRNKRNNLLITYRGRTQCLSAWAEEVGLHQGCLYYRIVTAGWTIERAITTPSRRVPLECADPLVV